MELKFRAWDHDLKYMFTIGDMPDLLIGFDGHIYNNGFPFTSQIKCISSSITLMQFTGLTDKNGKDIYEGDILSMWYAPQATAKGAVSFEDGCFIFSTKEATPESCPLYSIEGYGNDIEVIGNIHQHSHLLDKGE